MAKPKLRKMLGDIQSEECISMMRQIETQSKRTLASWAISYARENYLEIYEAACGKNDFNKILSACETYLAEDTSPELKEKKKLADLKPLLKEAIQIARDADDPIAQAAARALSTACATVQTPTNTLGFLFYGSAAAAYHEAGLSETPAVYDALASKEFKKALDSLKKGSVPEEPKPAKIKWGC